MLRSLQPQPLSAWPLPLWKPTAPALSICKYRRHSRTAKDSHKCFTFAKGTMRQNVPVGAAPIAVCLAASAEKINSSCRKQHRNEFGQCSPQCTAVCAAKPVLCSLRCTSRQATSSVIRHSHHEFKHLLFFVFSLFQVYQHHEVQRHQLL
jgi:hypothetical protein